MKRAQNIKRDYFWNSLGSTVSSFVAVILLIIVTRINGIDDSGLFSFAFGMIWIFYALALYGGRNYQVTDAKSQFSSREYIILKIATSVIALVVAIIFVLINQYDYNKSSLIIALVLYKIAEAIADALYGVLQRNNKLYIAGISLTLRAVVSMVVFLIVDFLTHNLLLSAISLTIVSFSFLFFFDYMAVVRTEKIKIFSGTLRQYIHDSKIIIKKNITVFLVGVLPIIILNIPRYLIDIFHQEQQGHYGILILPASFVAMLASFIIAPHLVKISELYKNKKNDEIKNIMGKIFGIIVAIGAVATVLAWLVGTWMLTLVFGVDLSNFDTALAIVVAGGVIYAMFTITSVLLLTMRHLKEQVIIYLITLIMVSTAGVFVVDSFAITGAAWLYAVLNTFQLFVLYLIYKKVLNGKKS
jgi:Membrane protein involved in the export of O-antigen and teichoic acid